MIYEIDKKPYFKVENYYAEVEIIGNRIVPAKVFRKIYCEDVDESSIKEYSSIQEYVNANKKGRFSNIED